MGRPGTEVKPPSAILLALEPRGLLSFPALLAAAPFLAAAPRGPRHAVIVLPGLGADDRSTVVIRRFLSYLGYEVHGWKRGRNIRPPGADLPAMVAQILALYAATGSPVSLVGWSRGGIIAREAARQVPHAVRLVITLGSPFAAPHASNVGFVWRRATGLDFPAWTKEQSRQPGGTAAGSEHVHLLTFGRCRRLAGLPRGGGTGPGERRGSHQPYRARLSSGCAVGHRRPAGAGPRHMEAIPARPSRCAVLSSAGATIAQQGQRVGGKPECPADCR